jgi:hypothetical protein
LEGIACVRLIDKLPADITLLFKEWRANNKHRTALGLYMPGHGGNRRPYVVMFMPKILAGLPRWFLWTPAPTLLFARVLAHEIGHHLVARRGYAFHPAERPRVGRREYEEEMVERYAFEVTRKMRRRWRYKLGQWLIKLLAEWRIGQARAAWEKKNYRKASDLFLQAFNFNPDYVEAGQWSVLAEAKAKEVLSKKGKS